MRERTPSLAAAAPALVGAVAAAALWVGPAPGQTEPHVSPDHLSPTPPAESRTEKPGESAPPAEAEMSREARLDLLFDQLAEAEEGPHERIEREIRRILSSSGSDTMDLLLMRARDAMEEEELVRAIHHLSAAVQHDPDFAEAWNMRATAFYLRGDLGQALADIERVLALEPRHFGALSGLGVILEQLGREHDALQAYREAARINPNFAQVEEAIARLAPKVDGRDI
jgi:tetratricopeptide (TPR) repeat protein